MVRRPTGGRAVLHDKELTYSVVSNDRSIFNLRSSSDTYQKLSRVLNDALASLGLRLSTGGLAREKRPGLNANNYLKLRHPCFTSATRHEILCNGKKIIGSAQRRLRRAFLQHGSLLLDCDFGLLAAVTRTSESYLRETITHINNECPSSVTEQVVIDRLRTAFETGFGIELIESGLYPAEWRTAERLAEKYLILTTDNSARGGDSLFWTGASNG